MSDPRTAIVQRAYEVIPDRFARWATKIEGDPRQTWTDELIDLLPDGGRVVDLGCGAGVPSTQALAAAGFDVTGVDFSAEQLRRARANVPDARFIEADVTELELPRESFDAVTAFYSLNHVPRDLLGPLLKRLARWLVRDGYFLAALGAGDSDDWIGEWLGVQMFFSTWDPETNRRLIAEAGLTLVRDEVIALHEPEGDAAFQWVLARK